MSLRLSEVDDVKKLNLLQYGDTGTGKTIRAASAHRWGPVYFFDFDGKLLGLKSWFEDKPEVLSKIEFDIYMDVIAPGESTFAAEAALKKLNEITKDVRAGKCKYSTIVLDSWTGWEQSFLGMIVDRNNKTSRAKTEVKITDDYAVQPPDMIDYRAHGQAQKEFLCRLLSLPLNVIINCHTKVSQDELTQQIDRGLAASGQLSKTLPKYFNEVHRTLVRNGKYVAQIKGDSLWPANSKLKQTDAYLEGDLAVFDKLAYRAPEAK